MLSDHHALSFIKQPKLFEGRRLRRWQMLLSEFQFIISYKPGVEIGLPDCLSRMPPPTTSVAGAISTNDYEWSATEEEFYLDDEETALETFIDDCSLKLVVDSHTSVALAFSSVPVRDSLLTPILMNSAQKSRLQRANRSKKNFTPNTAVWVDTPEWGRLPGKLLHRYWKGTALAKEQWWWVDFTDAGHPDPWAGEECRMELRHLITTDIPSAGSTDIPSPQLQEQVIVPSTPLSSLREPSSSTADLDPLLREPSISLSNLEAPL